MITHLSHATIWVTDHEQALAFYVDKLGFEKKTDMVLHGFRWLTIAPPKQRELELVLMLLTPSPMMNEETVEKMKELLQRGAMGSGVLTVDDCRATYADLKAKGVEFMDEPQERPYGIEAILKDPFGNWFSMTQPSGGPA